MHILKNVSLWLKFNYTLWVVNHSLLRYIWKRPKERMDNFSGGGGWGEGLSSPQAPVNLYICELY